ncbi:uncharacterized protein LOC110989920 [Acanthaster planci]|uniref:Uncharacterized protein LOC110989920 n=1 Tax=Acanthaster planci TaxID=133434 RepID=A0A8B8A349_ACAPL|nr:uncharacterized protein LOC110989920 [Acanthaster planci]
MEKGTLSKRALLGFPAFLVVQLILEGILLRSCSALERDLPEELNITKIRKRFCGRCVRRSFLCNPQNPQVCRMCREICRTDSKLRCWNDTDYTCGDRALETVCGYLDAVVCKNESANETCVYELCSEKKPVCTTSEQESNPEWAQKKSNRPWCRTTTQPPQTRGPAATTTALACVLSLVLFLVLAGAVVWYLRRRGNLPAFKKTPLNPANESDTEMDTKVSHRPPLPDPPALGSQEYSYTYGKTPGGQTEPGTGAANPIEEDDDEYHYYSRLNNEGEGESLRYVEGGPRAGKPSNTESPNNHNYSVLERSDDDGEKIAEDIGNDEAHSSPGEDNHSYFPLQKPPNRPSESEKSDGLDDQAHFPLQNRPKLQSGDENSGYQAVTISSKAGGDNEEASSPYDHLHRVEGKQSADGDQSDEGFPDYHHLEN